ncbi:hypothetical protein HMPREF1544_07153 [Mucor circinelloides 1006PhL]|uniref:PQ loop repeat protein n=1 Tax=Mucor circinelloides f. circinelloides (strain 1006PhL) TaxID=1220926 RepID=S2JCB7_MUCC1|nr:hypothetical protein HMPREF1544_07153 [Mucor circinelloides 1006PhL]KAG1101414.1 hypothetical protein G6F42_017510 [Rhizopus arrhizus]
MVNRYLVEQVFSYFGLVFWSLQLAPQAYKTYRRGTSTGVSVWTMLIWTSAGVFMGVYNIGLGVAIALWIQPQIFTFIACICLFQEFRYQRKWSQCKTCIGFILSCLFFAGLEVGLVFAFKKAEKVENQGAIHFFGILPVVTILGGFLPQYYEIFREKRVIGISHLFLAMDFFGSMFSTISLAFRDEIDALDLANYIAIACFDVGILVLYYMFEWYHKRKGVTGNDEDKTQNSKELSHNCETAPEIQTVQSAETFDLKLKG